MKGSLRVVLDTSPIIVLSRLGLLEKILGLFSEVEIPRGVLEEVEIRRDEVFHEVSRFVVEGRVRVEEVRKKLPRLGLGESSALLLALVEKKIVVLDDKKARKLARELGLEVIGTLSILKKLYDEGILTEAPDTIYRRLIETGFYIDKRLFDKIFKDRRVMP